MSSICICDRKCGAAIMLFNLIEDEVIVDITVNYCIIHQAKQIESFL